MSEIETIQLAPDLSICRILNGMWQVAGGHGQINHDSAEEIVELADLVTEMKEIKHPFKSGIKAKKGIDF